MDPLVSIIIPVYNAEPWLRQCLDSVLSQTYRGIEVICVDDGSTDGSAGILCSYAESDPRVKILSQPNRFAGAARNLGMDSASGEYLLFLDADDFFEPEMVETMVGAAQRDMADVVVCGSCRYDELSGQTIPTPYSLAIPGGDGPIDPDEISDGLFQMFVGWPWDKLFRAGFVREAGLRFQEQRSANDALFVFVALALASRVTAVTRVLATHRIGNSSSVSNTRGRSFDCAWTAMRAIRERLDAEGVLGRLERTFVNWQVHFSLWNYNSLAGEAKSALGRLICGELAGQVAASRRPEGFFTNHNEISQFREISETFSDWFGPGDMEMLAARPWSASDMSGSVSSGNRTHAPCVPDVSIIVPIYNVERYLDEALESLRGQELRNIEIVCIVDGATDRSLDIAKRHAAQDPRIVVVNKDNSGYGASMNMGIRCARGDYIGILEPDDFVLPEMFSTLYEAAEANDVQIVKSDFFRFSGEGDSIRRVKYYVGRSSDDADRRFYDRVLRPIDEQGCFFFEMNTWCGIYRRDFLIENDIWHNETPGASFQDNGFWLKGYCAADRVLLIDRPCYMNRRDNPGSSVHDRGKSLACRVEYGLIRDWMLERPELFSKVSSTYWRKYYDSLWVTLNRISASLKREVLELARDDMSRAVSDGELDLSEMPDWIDESIRRLLKDPIAYHFDMQASRIDELKGECDRLRSENERLRSELDDISGSYAFRVGSVMMKAPSALRRKIGGN